MKNLKISLSLVIFSFLLILSSCKKEPEPFESIEPSPSTNTGYFGSEIITTSVGGVIRDESGNAVANASVRIGTKQKMTNAQGVFLFKDIQVNAKRTYVKVEKNGYFHGSRALYPSANSTSYLNIELLSAATVGSFSATVGGTVSSSGVTLSFPSNGVKVEGGGVYSGNVNVALKFLDPNQDETMNQMPGDLMAVDNSDELTLLETYGMAAVELTSPTGQKLNVADGQKVEMKIPLSGPYLTDAPASIPLWYFDEIEGIWKEEGRATKVGNEYIGEVSHFSFWNCDNPNPSTSINGKVVCGTNPFANGLITITNPTGRVLGRKLTNSLGEFSGFIPLNTVLTIKLYASNTCNTIAIYTASIGPFTSPVVLPNISGCPNSVNSGILNITMQDCSSSPVSNGVLEVTIAGGKNYYFPDALGNINTNILYCAITSLDIQGYDYTNSKQSIKQTIATAPTMNYGNLAVCGNIDEYVLYNLDGTNYRIDKIPTNQFHHYTWSNNTHINAYEGTTTNNLNAKILGASVGSYAMEPDTSNLVNGLSVLSSATSMTATFTTYGTTPGSYKIGTFTGTFTDMSSVPHTLSGSFRLKNP